MKIPDLPIVSIDMDDKARSFVESLDNIIHKIDRIDVVRVEGNYIHVLGKNLLRIFNGYSEITQNRVSGEVHETSFKNLEGIDTGFAHLITLGLYSLSPNIRRRKKATNDYNRKVEQYRDENLKEIQDKIKDIRVYQGTIDEVQNELGKPLERVETDKPETFLKGADIFWLRVKAYLLGADAVVHYQPGSSIGTPVKYSDKKD